MEEHMSYPGVVVCGRCFGLRGPSPGGLLQRCGCEPSEPWPGHDLARFVELCRCCALEALPSGSRWSVWFCDECKHRALAFNDAMGRYVIPIGRHSLMKRIGVRMEEATDPGRVESFLGEIGKMFRAQDDTSAWAAIITRDNLRAICARPEVDVPLDAGADHHAAKP
jgi:hypothetical protein